MPSDQHAADVALLRSGIAHADPGATWFPADTKTVERVLNSLGAHSDATDAVVTALEAATGELNAERADHAATKGLLAAAQSEVARFKEGHAAVTAALAEANVKLAACQRDNSKMKAALVPTPEAPAS